MAIARCQKCNSELRECGPADICGEPTLVCEVCQLTADLATARRQIAVLGEEVRAWRGMPSLDHIWASYWADVDSERFDAAQAATDALATADPALARLLGGEG